MITTISRSRLAVALAAPMLLLALAACSATGSSTGSSSRKDHSSGSDTSSAPRSTSSAPTSSAPGTYADWELDFTRCLRDQGIDIKDPDPVTGIDDSVSRDDAYLAASKLCGEKVGGPPTRTKSTADLKKMREKSLEIAKCLRDHGINVNDPGPDQALAIEGNVPDSVMKACA